MGEPRRHSNCFEIEPAAPLIFATGGIAVASAASDGTMEGKRSAVLKFPVWFVNK
jgi:hypothetical protein